MLKLIKCEFWKLKRKKFIPLIILAAFLFPIPLTYLMTTPSIMANDGSVWDFAYLTETIFYKGIMPSETGFRFSSGL